VWAPEVWSVKICTPEEFQVPICSWVNWWQLGIGWTSHTGERIEVHHGHMSGLNSQPCSYEPKA
jgi:hypothetical protein